MLERLQKIIARAGVASRRQAEQLIVTGQVTVNGKIVTELGTKADAERDSIKVGAKRLTFSAQKTYYLFHKPSECVSTMHDPERRRSLGDFMHGLPGGIFPVGRLDYHASGAILLTSDGELANQMMRAAGSLGQRYEIKIKGKMSPEELRHLRTETGARVETLRSGENCWYELALGEGPSTSLPSAHHGGLRAGGTRGRREDLREVLAGMGHPVEKMKRVKLASLELASIPAGQYRALTPEEIAGLKRIVGRAYQPGRTRGEARPRRPRRRTRGPNAPKMRGTERE